MLKPANVAAPFTAFTEPPPDSVPPPGFALSASVIAPLKLVTLFSDASSALTFTGGVIVAPTCVLPGGMLNPRCVAGGGVPAATTRSTGTRAGLPTACAADTTITPWYSPASSPAGFSCTCTCAGVLPDLGVTSSHEPPESLTFHDSVPLPVLASIRLSSCGAELPLETLTRTRPGATVRAAAEGGLLISLSSLQVVRRTATTDAAAPIAHRLVTGRLRDFWISRGIRTKSEWTSWKVCKAHTDTGASTSRGRGVATPQQPGRRANQVIVPLR